ncbi:PHB depolymerase family esterase [Micromonospora sp. CV4]|uniref:alpha/beta hydrolase family esterase n=1 Tax=Micromonospora sp. CV4 TaxID=2478711 RepID=UPI000EF4BFB4|nr:PHB depolymerase family esterase [Micromonospora sp. CV4]RLP95226.1 polyhydroxybutyrate depolymerase [Micromonospora sp. CV4]
MAVLTGLCLIVAVAACERGEPSSAPPAAPSPSVERPAPGDHRLTLKHNGLDRTYLLHAPPGYDPSRSPALVIAMHFYPGTGSAMRELTGLDAKADKDNVLVAYPDGNAGGFNALICCGKADDVGFLNALTDHLVQTWRVDPTRVFLTGISNGADMSFRAAVESTGRFAAIGVVSGGYSGPLTTPENYVPKSPVSVITFIGSQDRNDSVFEAGMRTWQQRLRCKPSPKASGVPGVTRTMARCADGSDVSIYTIASMGHSWPGATTGQLAAPTAGLSASDLMWEFFAAHPRKATT